jgi:hypothetical protein
MNWLEGLAIGVAAPAVGGLAYVAYRHHATYVRLAAIVGCAGLLAIASMGIWNTAMQAAIEIGADATAAKSKMFSVKWPYLVAALWAYLLFLGTFPVWLGKKHPSN